ncbi:MAG: ABC transporter ATP-binding protein [Candidatus Limnocylindrales bacterium]
MKGVSVELRGVGLAYGDRVALRSVDLRLEPGQRLCLLGPNGAGKSSVLRCVVGTAQRRTGACLLDGIPLEEWSRLGIARRVAVVPGQVTLPFAMRVEEVVALGRVPHQHPFRGPRAADRAAVARAIARVGIADLADRDARELSLGERQLVVLAMAIAQETGLLVLDEPTAHLDLRHQVEVMALLTDLAERDGVTVLAVLHDVGLAARCFPRLILMQEGRVVADGPPVEVLSAARVRSVYGVDPRFVAVPV